MPEIVGYCRVSLGNELRALRALKREAKSPFVFTSERGAPFSVAGFAKRTGKHRGQAAVQRRIPTCCAMPVVTRWQTGAPTRTLQAYLGHRSIQSTVPLCRACAWKV
jgi:integrase